MEMSDDEKLLTFHEARQYLRIGRSTLLRFVESGRIEGYKVGTTWRFRLSDVKGLVVQRWTKDVN